MLSNALTLPHLLVIAVVVLIMFGKGKVSSLMGEVGKGITAFKKGVAEEDAKPAEDVQPAQPAQVQAAQGQTAPHKDAV